MQAQIQGLDGSLCTPKCKGMQCPSDKPDGCIAEPECALQSQSGDSYCALMCISDGTCPKGAKCGQVGKGVKSEFAGLGVCYFPDAELADSANTVTLGEQSQLVV